jgi:hypothetical protein
MSVATSIVHDLRHHGATMALNAGFTGEIVTALGWLEERADGAPLRCGHGSNASGRCRGYWGTNQ